MRGVETFFWFPTIDLILSAELSGIASEKLLLIISPIAWEPRLENIIWQHFILRAGGESDIEKIQEIKLGKWKLIEFSGLNQPTGE